MLEGQGQDPFDVGAGLVEGLGDCFVRVRDSVGDFQGGKGGLKVGLHRGSMGGLDG